MDVQIHSGGYFKMCPRFMLDRRGQKFTTALVFIWSSAVFFLLGTRYQGTSSRVTSYPEHSHLTSWRLAEYQGRKKGIDNDLSKPDKAGTIAKRTGWSFLQYTFEDPSTYKGPIVEGWPPGRSRNMSLYVRPEEDTVISDLACLQLPEDLGLLIMIQSDPTKFERRQANRNTWMRVQERYPRVKTLFIFGKSPVLNVDLERELRVEQSRYCDLLQMDFVDFYTNITLDTVFALKFVIGRRLEPDFLLIGDDDAYINIPAMWSKLFEQGVIRKTDPKLLGFRFNTSPVLTEKKPWTTHQKYVGRLIVPPYLYNKTHYPDSMGGAAYILPQTTLSCLYDEALRLPYFHLNDIFLTAFAATNCGFKRINDRDFHPGTRDPKSVRMSDVSFHWSDAWRKSIYYDILEKQNGVLTECAPKAYCVIDGMLHYCEHKREKCFNVESFRTY